MALVAALFATMLLTCLGMSLVLLGSAATALTAHDRQATDAVYAAEAAIGLATSEIRERADWSGVITAAATPADICALPGRFTDASFFPRAAWDGSLLDLHALTAQLQASEDAAAPAGVAPPVWRLFEYGPISRLIPSDPRRHLAYVIVWTADGGGGLVLVRANARGPSGARASVEASLARNAAGVVVCLATRSVR